MFKNYATIAIRNLVKHKVYSLINIAGLAIGIACCVLMILFIQDELSYDRFHEKANQIYQVGNGSPSAWGPALKAEIPEVLEFVRFEWVDSKILVNAGDKRFYERDVAFADASAFKIFSFPLVSGNFKTVFEAPFSVVITEDMAQKYFGDQNPIGQTIGFNIGQVVEMKVTGVLRNLPRNSHLQFDFLVPFTTVFRQLDWRNQRFDTFVLLPKEYDYKVLEAQLPAFFERHGQDHKNEHLTSLTRLHVRANAMNKIGEYTHLYLLGAIAVLVLLLACVNFTNLATARSFSRMREVGMRKVSGARRGQVIQQFLGESILFSVISLVFAIMLVEVVLPIFNAFADKTLSVPYFTEPGAVVGCIGLVLIVGILAGSYPALFLSAFQPASIFRGAKGTGRAMLRRGLVVFQFSVAILLIVITGFAYQQLTYLQNKNLGFDKDQVIILPILKNEALVQKRDVIKQALLRSPHVLTVAASHREPGQSTNANSFVPKGDPNGKRVVIAEVAVDHDYLSLYDIDLVAGQPFSSDMKIGASDACIVNEQAVKHMQLSTAEEAIGMQSEFKLYSKHKTIVGVMKDYNFRSLKWGVWPLVIHLRPNYTMLSIKIRPDNLSETMVFLESTWKQFAPEFPFEYSFLDASLNRLYQNEVWWSQIFAVFSGLAIFIACLGLLGLAALMTEQRTKEIGIRKVMGASVASVVVFLSWEYIKLVVAANLIAWPIAYWVTTTLLKNYAYRIDTSFSMFLIGGVFVLSIAIFTVWTQAFRAARANPVDALRYE